MKEHILVVDDEAHIRELLATFFKKREFRVSCSESAADALQTIEEAEIDVVIMDIALGDDDDGLDALVSVKETHPNLPVIILTGMGFDDDLLQEAADKGAAGYVSKTLPLNQLLAEVRKALKGETSFDER